MIHVATALAATLALASAPAGPHFAPVTPGMTLTFPKDHGAHPAFRTEWWYLTGWLKTRDQEQLGFQVTFFRSRTGNGENNPSAFAPRQVLFAHAALSDPAIGHLLHDQRIVRAGFGLGEASTADTDIRIQDWSLRRSANGEFRTRANGADFGLDLAFTPTQPPFLQGKAGFSRKGPRRSEASYYYSQPHLIATGYVIRKGRKSEVTGEAWLDREWSSTYLDPAAIGWDWVGLNLTDGSALMAFRIRARSGGTFWAGGSFRTPGGAPQPLSPADVTFTPERIWRSPRTGARYPVQQTVTIRLRDGSHRWRLTPLFDDQELDGRDAGGPVYWEGAVNGPGVRGYLELTGYLRALVM